MENILINETIEKFGYNPCDLKPNSCKLVVWGCGQCGNLKDKQFRSAKKNELCIVCSNKKNGNTNIEQRSNKLKEWYKHNDHPLKGTKRPDHVIEALRLTGKRIRTKEECEHRSKLFAGDGNPMYGKKHTEEALKKMCDYQKENVRTGKDCNFYGKTPKHGRGSWYECKDGSKVWMRSSWEVKFATYLDNNNIEWLYEIKKFPITYLDTNGTYTPDFYLVEDNKYIEVKGWWRDDAKIKFDSFQEQYSDIKIELYDKAKLKEIKVL